MATVHEAAKLIGELCAQFYTQGWVSGTGGGMSIKSGDSIVMAPSGNVEHVWDPNRVFFHLIRHVFRTGNALK